MKILNFLVCVLTLMMLGVFAACGSDNDEPKPNDDNNKEQPVDPKNPESKLVSAEEFLEIVDGKVWVFDPENKTVLINANGEEFPESAWQTVGQNMRAHSFRDGKIAILLWPSFVKAP